MRKVPRNVTSRRRIIQIINLTRLSISQNPLIWRGVAIEEAITRLPFLEKQTAPPDLGSDLVDFIESFTIAHGLDEQQEFLMYIEKVGFSRESLLHIYQEIPTDLYEKVAKTLRYHFTFHRVFAGLGGEDMLNATGLPYLYEAAEDLTCTLSLGRLKYHKQSLQMLRSALEAAVIHAYFTVKNIDYDSLTSALGNIPSMNNRTTGMLHHLLEKDFMKAVFADEIRSIYQSLSNAVHSRFPFVNTKFETDDDRDRLRYWSVQNQNVCLACIKLLLCVLKFESRGH